MGLSEPMVFKKPHPWNLGTRYPVNVTEYIDDDTFVGTIDEGKLTTTKRILLNSELS